MNQKIINSIKRIIPPIVLDVYRKLSNTTEFSGNYHTWEDARQASTGYDTDVILNKVKDALLKVKNGEAVYERDSVLFDKIEYSWPLLASLMWIAASEGGNLNIIDFGGSLGSTYFQNRKFLVNMDIKWNIVEQKHFVECGKKYFGDDRLNFYYDLESCLKEQKPSAIIFSSVLQYMGKPYEFMNSVQKHRFKYILIDRTAFIAKGDDIITIQRVPKEIYQASYPAWFFNQEKFLNFFSGQYELIADFESNDRANIPSVFKGFLFVRKH